MDPLAGWTVAVTADRRAEEQAEMLRARGAAVILAPTIATESVDDATTRAATDRILAGSVDIVVANTGIGMRAWIAAAWSWGLGTHLHDMLSSATVVARGAKAAGALLSDGINVSWRAADETLAGVLDHLLDEGVAGRRIAVQLHGGEQVWFGDRLRAAGATVVDVPVYRWVRPPSARPIDELADAIGAGLIGAVTFTSPAAVHGLLEGRVALATDIETNAVVCGCVGPVTAAAAVAAGLSNVVAATPSRLGAMIRVLGETLASRAVPMTLAGRDACLQGNLLTVGDASATLTRLERALLVALFESNGAVLSRARLAALAWSDDVSEHAVVTAVNRLRRKLGPVAGALQTTSRRGYRLHVA